MKIKKYNKSFDTKFATDMLPVLRGNGSFGYYMLAKRQDRLTAKKYGLDYKSMTRWKLTYYVLNLASGFALSSHLYDRLPPFVFGFVFSIWLLLVLFYLPKHFVYRFAKKLN